MFPKKITAYKRLQTNVFSNQTTQDNVQIFKEFPPRQANKHPIQTLCPQKNKMSEKKKWGKTFAFFVEKNHPGMAVGRWGKPCMITLRHVMPQCPTTIQGLLSPQKFFIYLFFLLIHFHFKGSVCIVVCQTNSTFP